MDADGLRFQVLTTIKDHRRRQVLLPIQRSQSCDSKWRRSRSYQLGEHACETASQEEGEEAHDNGGSERAIPLDKIQNLGCIQSKGRTVNKWWRYSTIESARKRQGSRRGHAIIANRNKALHKHQTRYCWLRPRRHYFTRDEQSWGSIWS